MAYSYESPEHRLRLAAREGDTNTVRTLLDQGVNIEGAPRQGVSALALAVREMHLKTARLLLERGADVKRLDFSHPAFSLSAISCYATNPAMIRLLAEYGFIESCA